MMIFKMWSMKAWNPAGTAYLSCSAKSDSANSPNINGKEKEIS